MVQDQGVILKPLENHLVRLDTMRGVALGNVMQMEQMVQWNLRSGAPTRDGRRSSVAPSVA